ncbi:MAG TPA: glycerol dehydrogenase, partial [Candidatus Merdenecus merdavium]|nr:glycerol dehydrogenase [Candidatus Merdenecus merdavium]
MAQVLIAPSKYVQGKEVIYDIAKYVGVLGSNPLCLISESGLKRTKPSIEASYKNTDQEVNYEVFQGECS